MKFANPSKKTKSVASTRGHALEFPGRAADGTLTYVHVPAVMQGEVLAAGMDPETEIEETEAAAGPVRPENLEAFTAAVNSAFDDVVGRGEREDFAGNGSPRVEAVNKVLGWKLEGKEVKELWPLYQAGKQTA